jgi:ubiquinone biosynthesis protein
MSDINSKADLPGPARFVFRLNRLGLIATKVGQYLALRPDLLPQEYCDALLRLTDSAPPVEWPKIRQVIEEELGEPPERIFRRLERRPIATGSLAQVHRAALDDGTEVAIKVQRPGLPEQLAKDLRRLTMVARLIVRSGVKLPVAPLDVADEIRDWLHQEIDFVNELENVQRMRRLARDSGGQRIPRAFPHLSGRRVLTYEYMGGVPLTDILTSLRTTQRSALDSAFPGIDLQKVAENLVHATLTQIFRYRFFHADLHPGNLRILPDNIIGYVDFGLCDALDENIRANQQRYISAVYDLDEARIFRALTEILSPGPASDIEQLRRDFMSETRSLEGRQHATTGVNPPGRTPASLYIIGLMRAARRNGFRVPRRVLLLYRALLTVETLSAELGLTSGLQRSGRRFFERLQREELFSQLFDRERFGKALANSLTLVQEGPGQLSQIMADLSEGSLRLRVEVTEAPSVVRLRNRQARLWAAAIVSVGMSMLLSSPALPKLAGISVGWPLGAVLAALYIYCLILWRRL